MKQVVIVVPIYKPTLCDLERAGFQHNAEILKNYDMVAVYPEGMDVSFYKRLAPSIRFQSFPLKYFNGVRGYNRLMIAPFFYQAFSEYTYMLVCQYDAWVFKDELVTWCEMGYDYVAAPFLQPFPLGRTSKRLPWLANLCLNKIGNGGLCLRKIDTYISAAKRLRPFSVFYFYNEDVFWSLFPPLVLRRYHRPGVAKALRFSGRIFYEGGVLDDNGELPFGCHGWFRPNEIELWKQYIEAGTA